MWFVWKIVTGEVERVSHKSPGLLGLVVLLLLVAACSAQKSEPESLPPQSVSKATLDDSEFEEYVVTQEDEAVVEEPRTAPAEQESEPPAQVEAVVADEVVLEDDTVIVIEDKAAEDNAREMSLAESARAERQRRGEAQKADIVITDKNLPEYAKGQLTISEGTPNVITNDSLDSDGTGETDLAQDEEYWRGRGYEIRLAWKEAYDRVEELEGDVFNLRMRFYAEDDPFYRDSQIKPAWDHAIEDLNQARDEVELRQRELEEFMEEGRVAGALPGWLREGVELEPKLPDEEAMGISEPGEPDLMDESIQDPQIAPDPGGDPV